MFWVYLFFQIDTGLEIAVLKFHDFSGFFMSVRTLNVMIGCGSGAGVWGVDNLFEAADSSDVFAYPRITNVQCVANANPS